MGVKDQGLQEYLKDNERFADFVNGTLFAGKQIVDPCYLKEVQRKKRVSYKQSIMAKNIQKKNSSEKYGEEEIAREKGVFEEGEFGDDSAKLMIWKESAISFVSTISQAVDFCWHVKLNLGQIMRCL